MTLSLERARSRRGFLKTGLGLGALGFFGAGLTACGGGATGPSATSPHTSAQTYAPITVFAAASSPDR